MFRTLFPGLFRASEDDSEPEPVAPPKRLADLEGEVLDLRAQQDSMYTILKRMQGKIYRGVPLGETFDVVPEGTEPQLVDEEYETPAKVDRKADIRQRANALRRR